MKIKQLPEDFCVEEIITIKTKRSGDFTYFWLIKKNWTTMRAIQQIAKQCHVSKKRFRFAGTKDKVALTKQLVSAYKVDKKLLENVKLKDIKIKVIGKGDKQISLGDLKGNKFQIIIRDLKKDESKKLKTKLLKVSKGFKNYFGPQRFGRGNTHKVGREILKGNLEKAVKLILTFTSKDESEDAKAFRRFAKENWGKWKSILKKAPKFLGIEKALLNWLILHPNDFAGALRKIPKPIRKMYVHAYQAWIFNKALHELKIIRKKVLPVVGSKTKLGTDKFSKTVKALLKKDGIKLEDFSSKRMPELASEGNFRKAVIKPKQFKIGKILPDELNKDKFKIKLSFILPKGAYATTLIEAANEDC